MEFSCNSVHAKNAEFGRSVFENARVFFRLWEFHQDLQDSRNMIVAQHGLHLKNFQVRGFFCAFLPRIWHNFHWDMRFSEVQYNGSAAWMRRPRSQLKGLKVYYLLGGSLDLCLDVLPFLSAEVHFWPPSPCFWVQPLTRWSGIYFLNIGLSLLLSVKISVLNKFPSEIVNEVVVVQMTWQFVAPGGIFGSHQILLMRTFASEFVQEPLMGVHPNDLEVIPLIFDAIATRVISLVIHMCLFF
jgi:hypothetical protein